MAFHGDEDYDITRQVRMFDPLFDDDNGRDQARSMCISCNGTPMTPHDVHIASWRSERSCSRSTSAGAGAAFGDDASLCCTYIVERDTSTPKSVTHLSMDLSLLLKSIELELDRGSLKNSLALSRVRR
jgi:hypothetical protein